MTHRVWGELSDSYRERLERGGINQAAYERGDSLKAARGHKAGKTPEHPSDIHRHPSSFTEYRERKTSREQSSVGNRDDLIEHAMRNAVRMIGNEFSFNPRQVRRNLRSMTIGELQRAATINGDEWKRLAKHQGKRNPWWYK